MPTFSCWTRCGPTSSLSTWTLRSPGLANRTGRSEAEDGAPPRHRHAGIGNEAASWRVRLQPDAQRVAWVSVLAEVCLCGRDATGLGVTGHGIALLRSYLVVGVSLVIRSFLPGLAALLAQFGVCQRLDLYGLGLLDTHVLGVASLVVALFPGHRIGRFGLRDQHLVPVAGLAGVAVFQFGARDLFLRLGFLVA